jgi:hypothetical protein
VSTRRAILVSALAVAVGAGSASAQQRFYDDFEHGLKKWDLTGVEGAMIRDSGDPAHGHVLLLRPQGDVLALIHGSERWGPVRIEGDVLFPTDEQNYLGVVYNEHQTGNRRDFGLIYIKGNGSYLMVNPHRDFNVGRTLYEEFHVDIAGDDAIRVNQWTHFKMEVVGNACHFYVGDVTVPQLTFSFLELSDGAVGLQPRSVGGDVWVDNVAVTSITKFAYQGPPHPTGIQYDPEAMLTTWRVLGPLPETHDDVARDPRSVEDQWKPFETDPRGAVITGRVVDYHGPNTVAYFRAEVTRDEAGPAVLRLSTVDDLALWVNGHFECFLPRQERAWYDFWRNDQHEGERVLMDLVDGRNDIVIRVRGGVYATGGFFARVERAR